MIYVFIIKRSHLQSIAWFKNIKPRKLMQMCILIVFCAIEKEMRKERSFPKEVPMILYSVGAMLKSHRSSRIYSVIVSWTKQICGCDYILLEIALQCTTVMMIFFHGAQLTKPKFREIRLWNDIRDFMWGYHGVDTSVKLVAVWLLPL